MFSRLRKRHGGALPVAVLALIVAVAFAGVPAIAQPVANTSASIAKQVRKALRLGAVANKRSVNAIKIARNASKQAGPEGPAGPQGPKGDTGAKGDKGDTGDKGDNGDNGQSVTAEAESPGANCAEGGVELTSASGVDYVCNGLPGANGNNGAPGEDGEDGSPWVVGTAPSGVTLKGTWAVHTNAAAADEPIPLAFSTGVPVSGAYAPWYLTTANQDNAGDLSGCTGNADQPTPGNAGVICVYEKGSSNVTAPSGVNKLLNSTVNNGGGGAAARGPSSRRPRPAQPKRGVPGP